MQSDDDEFWFPWMTGWKLVEAVTIREAACILSHVDPAPYRYGNLNLPGDVEAMEVALEQESMKALFRSPAKR